MKNVKLFDMSSVFMLVVFMLVSIVLVFGDSCSCFLYMCLSVCVLSLVSSVMWCVRFLLKLWILLCIDVLVIFVICVFSL